MAKLVVAGRSDCPYFARAELLGDRLAKNLKKFKIHKIMIQPDQWDDWLKKTCEEKGWEFSKSPIVWRELIDRGGKGVLIGGANEFQEYVKAYYDLESDMNSYDMRTISDENKITKDELDQECQEWRALSQPVHVCLSNASHPACYHMVSTLGSGTVLGKGIELTLRLLITDENQKELVHAMAMEAEDLAQGLLRGVKVYTDPAEAFKGCSYIILLNQFPQEDGELKVDHLKRNHEFFSSIGKIINKNALPSCKVMLAGDGPLNFNAMAVQSNTPKLARQNIVVVSAVIENHAKAVIGDRLTVNPAGVVNLLVWGSINCKHFFDVDQCRIHGYDGAIWGPYWHSVDAREMVHDPKWLAKEFTGLVEARRQKLSEQSVGRSSGLSMANSICTTLQHWCCGSPTGQVFSLGVYSENWYRVPEGLFFSVPVTMDPKGFWHVVQDINVSPEIAESINLSVQDLKLQLAIFSGEISELDKGEESTQLIKDPSSGKIVPGIVETEPSTELNKTPEGGPDDSAAAAAGATSAEDLQTTEVPATDQVETTMGAAEGETTVGEPLPEDSKEGAASPSADVTEKDAVDNSESLPANSNEES